MGVCGWIKIATLDLDRDIDTSIEHRVLTKILDLYLREHP